MRALYFPELPEHGDVSDWLALGHSIEALHARADALAPATAAPSVNDQAPSTDDQRLDIRRMSDVQRVPIEWLWRNRIALGKQTLIGGEPGLGKSQLVIALAAAVTTGGRLPCDEGHAPLGNVVILSAEDDAADTIRPRLDAAGADASRVYQITAVQQRDGSGRRTFNLQADLALLERTIVEVGDVRLVVIDPVSSYLGKVDSHKNADVRSVLEPLGDMASRRRVAVVAITHFSKGAGKSAVNAFIGSIAHVAAARAAFTVMRDPDSADGARRLFLAAKNNLGPDAGGLAFRLEQRLLPGDDLVASAVAWCEEKVTRTADDILSASKAGDGERSAKDDAMEFLRDVLAAGPVDALDIEAQARSAAMLSDSKRISECKPIRAAAAALGVVKKRVGFGPGARLQWSLPDGDPTIDALRPHRCPLRKEGIYGRKGHLWGSDRPPRRQQPSRAIPNPDPEAPAKGRASQDRGGAAAS